MNESDGAPRKRQGARNPGASFQQKLRHYAKSTGDDVGSTLTRYVSERFLYRLSLSPYRSRFILRGATLFTLWDGQPHRATRDIDVLASGDSSPAALRHMMSDLSAQPVEADGVTFLTETLHVEERAEGRVYPRIHIEMLAELGTARPRLEIDVAFGEAVLPPPTEEVLPVLLEMPAPRLLAYRMETAVAEKCEALVSLGIPNTRMKDFYDLWYLSRRYPFDGSVLSEALQATFTRRNTLLPEGGTPEALTADFAEDAAKQRQWGAFLGKNRLKKTAAALPELISNVHLFLQPPLAALAAGRTFKLQWTPEGLWQSAARRTDEELSSRGAAVDGADVKS